jgi:hypothetical protein
MKEYPDGKLEKLAVLWTSPDREVALKMVFMYTRNANKNDWWDVVRIIIWGPSAKLLANDEELQVYVKEMMANGIEFVACKGCSDIYGVSDSLTSLGIEVLYIGEPFTKILKSDWKVLTI